MVNFEWEERTMLLDVVSLQAHGDVGGEAGEQA